MKKKIGIVEIESDTFLTDEQCQKLIDELNSEEVMNYVVKVQIKKLDDGRLDVNYDLEQPKFERIRRITGYLTGTLNSWNDSKRMEEKDRVKHKAD